MGFYLVSIHNNQGALAHFSTPENLAISDIRFLLNPNFPHSFMAIRVIAQIAAFAAAWKTHVRFPLISAPKEKFIIILDKSLRYGRN